MSASKAYHNLVPNSVEEETSTFLSKTFLIRYADEEVELNDVAHFRSEVEVGVEYLDTDFFIEIEMLYAPVIHSSNESVEDQVKRMTFIP